MNKVIRQSLVFLLAMSMFMGIPKKPSKKPYESKMVVKSFAQCEGTANCLRYGVASQHYVSYKVIRYIIVDENGQKRIEYKTIVNKGGCC